jgi:hypothetical protein
MNLTAVMLRPVRRLALLIMLTGLVGLLVAGCDSGSDVGPSGGAAVDPTPAQVLAVSASCTDFPTWREAQDEMEADSETNVDLDEDGDGVACAEDLGQPEYEEAWSEAYPEACASLFDESSSGALYGDDGTEYTNIDCESADPGAGEWEADAFSEPADDGHRDGWQSACEETFGPSVAFGDLQMEDEGLFVTQSDCENQSPY